MTVKLFYLMYMARDECTSSCDGHVSVGMLFLLLFLSKRAEDDHEIELIFRGSSLPNCLKLTQVKSLPFALYI